MWRLQTDKGEVRGGNGQSFVGLHRRQRVLSLGVALCLIQLDSGFVGVVAEILAVVLEEAVLRVVFVKVSGLVLSFQTDLVSGETTQVCDL